MKREAIVGFVLAVLFLFSVFPISVRLGTADSHGGSGFLPPPPTLDYWPMFRHDLSHTGYSTSTAPNTNQTLWNYTTGASVFSSPAVANSMVYVGSDDGKVYALYGTTGVSVWNYTTGGSVRSSPAVANGIVYVGSIDGKVYALNATIGTQVWNYTTSGQVFSSPAVAGGVVYVGSIDGKVYALNATIGTQVWNYTTGWYVESSPAIASGMVYVGSDDGKVYALNATTGVSVWNYTAGSLVFSSPAVAFGILYVGSADSKVYAFSSLHDVAIFNVEPLDVSYDNSGTPKTVVGRGYSLDVNVTAADLEYFTETFNVTVYANTTYVTSQNVTLSSGALTTLALTWSTTGFAYGNYTLSGYAWPVPGETNTANNNYTDGVVTVTIPGDINGDFNCGLPDLGKLAKAYNSHGSNYHYKGEPVSPNWNANADINGDGTVGLSDLGILAKHYNQHYP